MRPKTLSGRLPVKALVSLYLTNKLIGREPLPKRQAAEAVPAFSAEAMRLQHVTRY